MAAGAEEDDLIYPGGGVPGAGHPFGGQSAQGTTRRYSTPSKRLAPRWCCSIRSPEQVAARLDTHCDQEVRQALEPLVDIADQTGAVVCGLIHSTRLDPPTRPPPGHGIQGVTAVGARSTCGGRDTDDETGRRRPFATPKSNLGSDDLPLLAFTITGTRSPRPRDRRSSRIQWDGKSPETSRSPQRRHRSRGLRMSAEARQWLADYMMAEGGKVAARDVIAAYAKATGDNVANARRRLNEAKRRLWATPQSQSDSCRALLDRRARARWEGLWGEFHLSTLSTQEDATDRVDRVEGQATHRPHWTIQPCPGTWNRRPPHDVRDARVPRRVGGFRGHPRRAPGAMWPVPPTPKSGDHHRARPRRATPPPARVRGLRG